MVDVVLYHGLASTCSKKVRIALYEKGVPFESRLLDLQKFEQHDPQFLAINPNGVVPALVHNDLAIVESSIIAEYVDEAFPGPPLMPSDPYDRARTRIWLRFSDDEAYPAIAGPTWQYMHHRAAPALAAQSDAVIAAVPSAERRERWQKMARGGYSDAEIEDAVTAMRACLARLDSQLTETPWLAGPSFSIADMAVLPFVVRMRNLRPDLLRESGSFSAVRKWLSLSFERPSVQRGIDFTEDPRAAELPNI